MPLETPLARGAVFITPCQRVLSKPQGHTCGHPTPLAIRGELWRIPWRVARRAMVYNADCNYALCAVRTGMPITQAYSAGRAPYGDGNKHKHTRSCTEVAELESRSHPMSLFNWKAAASRKICPGPHTTSRGAYGSPTAPHRKGPPCVDARCLDGSVFFIARD